MANPVRLRPKILVVDDEPDAIELIEFNLKQAGFDILRAADGAEALQLAHANAPNLILLDLMLPEIDGLEVCKLLRRDAATADIPIIMVTAKASELDRILGLEMGADDYLTKPFSPRELVLRVKNTLKRIRGADEMRDQFQVGPLRVDVPSHLATVAGETIDLTATEFKLLALLLRRRGRVQSREQLLHEVWGYDVLVDTRTVDTHIRRLRDKLGTAARYLSTIRGIGYRFNNE